MNENINLKCSRCNSQSCADDYTLCHSCGMDGFKYYKDNVETEKARGSIYRAANKEVLAERAKLYRLKTKEIKAEYCRKFRQIIIACPYCNIDIKKYRKVEHDKTIKHLSNLALFEKMAVAVYFFWLCILDLIFLKC
jgi:hypothetical protein